MGKVSVVTVPCAHPHSSSSARDADMAKRSVKEENTAIEAYEERGEKATNPKLKNAFAHAKEEEQEHSAMFAKHAGLQREESRHKSALGKMGIEHVGGVMKKKR